MKTKLLAAIAAAMLLSGCTSSAVQQQLSQNQQTIQQLRNQVIDLQAENQGLQGQLQAAKQGRIPSGVIAVDQGDARGGAYTPNVAAGKAVASQPSGGYEDALQLYRAGDLDGAIQGFQQYLSNGQGKHAAMAQYWIGSAYYTQRNYQEATRYLGTFLKNMPDSDKTQNALSMLITSLKAVGRNGDAKILQQQGVSAIQ